MARTKKADLEKLNEEGWRGAFDMLNDKQKAFVEGYLQHMNATQAAMMLSILLKRPMQWPIDCCKVIKLRPGYWIDSTLPVCLAKRFYHLKRY